MPGNAFNGFLGARRFLALAAIAVAVFISYSNTFHASFHFDDAYVVDHDSAIRNFDWKGILQEAPSRSVGNLTFAVNYFLGKREPFGYHAVNLAIHLCAAICVYFLALLLLTTPALRERPLRRAQGFPLSVALLFAVHPIQTQAVTYIVQ